MKTAYKRVFSFHNVFENTGDIFKNLLTWNSSLQERNQANVFFLHFSYNFYNFQNIEFFSSHFSIFSSIFFLKIDQRKKSHFKITDRELYNNISMTQFLQISSQHGHWTTDSHFFSPFLNTSPIRISDETRLNT